MQCPNDKAILLITERQGIEIDYCPTCRGVWLDKGELDKLIAGNENAKRSVQPSRLQEGYNESHHHHNKQSNYSNGHDSYHTKRKKESFLGEIFDF